MSIFWRSSVKFDFNKAVTGVHKQIEIDDKIKNLNNNILISCKICCFYIQLYTCNEHAPEIERKILQISDKAYQKFAVL